MAVPGAEMRIYEGNYAYEVEQVIDPATLIPLGWKYNLYRVRPINQLLQSGTAQTKEAAEAEGQRAVQESIQNEGSAAA